MKWSRKSLKRPTLCLSLNKIMSTGFGFSGGVMEEHQAGVKTSEVFANSSLIQ